MQRIQQKRGTSDINKVVKLKLKSKKRIGICGKCSCRKRYMQAAI